MHAEEVEVWWSDLHRADGNPRSCDKDRQTDGDCAPAERKMESMIAHGNQQRLDEEEHVPRRNGEAVDKV